MELERGEGAIRVLLVLPLLDDWEGVGFRGCYFDKRVVMHLQVLFCSL